jgi:transposase-like protein
MSEDKLSDLPIEKVYTKKSKKYKYRCNLCGEKFVRKTAYETIPQHFATEHCPNYFIRRNKIVCMICEGRVYSIHEHNLLHQNSYCVKYDEHPYIYTRCKICNLETDEFSIRRHLEGHRKYRIDYLYVDQRYVCKTCGAIIIDCNDCLQQHANQHYHESAKVFAISSIVAFKRGDSILIPDCVRMIYECIINEQTVCTKHQIKKFAEQPEIFEMVKKVDSHAKNMVSDTLVIYDSDEESEEESVGDSSEDDDNA